MKEPRERDISDTIPIIQILVIAKTLEEDLLVEEEVEEVKEGVEEEEEEEEAINQK